jgi:hypothetical protein
MFNGTMNRLQVMVSTGNTKQMCYLVAAMVFVFLLVYNFLI